MKLVSLVVDMAKKVTNMTTSKSLTATGLTSAQTKALLLALAKRESNGNYQIENKFGYLGAYQFGAAALVDVGLISQAKYATAIKSKSGIANGANATNHKAFLAENKAGLLMAAHLKGAGNAIKFAKTGIATKDGFGTSIKDYYDLGAKSVRGI